MAGSDYSHIDLPGVVRNYVRVEGELAAAARLEALEKGWTFVTNGPLLEASVESESSPR